MSLENIETVVFVMLENRSFDQMLGYLSLDETENRLPVDGLRSDKEWQERFTNTAGGQRYPLRKFPGNQRIRQDPPHGVESINKQIRTPAEGAPIMGGYVSTYLEAHDQVDEPGAVMGYYDAKDVPTFDFLARNFCICDRWFTSLPLGTQANRLMAMAGESRVLDNVYVLPSQQLVYDWLDQRDVSWRVYISGGFTPFFILMARWSAKIVTSIGLNSGSFRRFSKFRRHWRSSAPLPSVIFIEPEYTDAPRSDPNDDHPPAQISKGQDFVRDIYEVVTSNPARWERTLMIVTYDEHGGFFDHVAPLEVEAAVNDTPLSTTGPRVPALLISPFVEKGQVFSEPLDHTSILQFIADLFGDGTYSPAVTKRQGHFGRIADALRAQPRAEAPPAMPARVRRMGVEAEPLNAAPAAPDTPNAAAIDAVMRRLAVEHREMLDQPEWAEMRRYLEINEPPVPTHRDNIGDIDDV